MNYRVALCLAVLLLLLAGCEKPGEGAKAEMGYKLARPVIAALDKYRQAEGRYPGDLQALVPAYMDPVPTGPDLPRLDYRLTSEGASYELTFRYVGPGMNVCNYTPGPGWNCYGYY